ncbi:MAG: formate dehydrogenase, partial [Methanomicrobiales archaeon]
TPVNGGQCQELCPAEIPKALFMHTQQQKLDTIFSHVSGVNIELMLFAFVNKRGPSRTGSTTPTAT